WYRTWQRRWRPSIARFTLSSRSDGCSPIVSARRPPP
ncbi:MAG: hypothetical protein AVDCRST_MAG33-1854, partial [uncultured Thermomicrobiales bacterium]